MKCLDMMISGLVFFKDKLLLRSHWIKRFNSWLITDSIVSSFLAGSKNLVSSAEW